MLTNSFSWSILGGNGIGSLSWIASTTVNTARLRRIVGWVKRSETQQIASHGWVSLPQPNLHQLQFRAYPSSIATTVSLPLRRVYEVGHAVGIGALIEVGKWVHLQQQLSQAWQWILASTVSWAIALTLGWTIGGVLRLLKDIFIAEIVGLTVAWIVVAAMIGVTLPHLADGASRNQRPN